MAITILAYAIAMAVATFIENDYGTPTAKALIYNTKWFEVLMLILTINFIGNIFKYRLYRREKWPVFLFHIAFVITLVGSFISRYYSYEGIMPIREGKVSSTIYSDRTYIMTRVDDNKVMKTYGENDPVMFGQIGNNSYSRTEKFGQGDKKIPFTIELTNFVMKAKEKLVEDPKGDSYLHIVESSKGTRNDIFLKEGEIKSIRNILFTYNNPIEGGMNITVKDGVKSLQPVFKGTYMEMKTQKLTEIPKDSLSPLQIKKLYTFDNLRFVINNIANGKVIKETAPKSEQEMHPYDALTFKIRSGEEEKEVTVRGTSGAVAQPEKVSLNGLNFNISYGSKEIKAPFSLKLRNFELERYPGTNSASSYASEVTVIDKDKTFDFRIFMNHVLDYKGYRFFQSSYDQDEKGTILSVNHDYWGTLVTYIGYLLMGIGMFFSLFWKGTRFMDLSKKLDKLTQKKNATLIVLLCLSLTAFSQKHSHPNLTPEQLQKQSVSKEHADKFAHLLIQDHQGRIKPVNTYALESLRKIFKKDSYKGLSAEQVLLSAQLNPKLWSAEPIIFSHEERFGKGSKIIKDLDIHDKHTNMINFFNQGGYYLENLVAESFRKKKANRTAEDKEIIDLDERANIWYSLLNGSLMHIYPKKGDDNNKWYSGMDEEAFVAQDTMILKMHQMYMRSLVDAIKTNNYKQADEYLSVISDYQNKLGASIIPPAKKVDLEIKYNRYNIFLKLLIFYFTIGFILIFLTFIDLFKPKNKLVNNLLKVFIGITILGLIAHTIGLGVRWYVSGHEPWSNSYEATVFIAWVIIIAGLIFTRNRSKFIISASVIFAGFLLGIAHGNLMSPEMTNLVPVLKSYWLMVHVAIITASYGFLGLGSLLGAFALLLFLIRTPENRHKLEDTIKELTYINEMTMTIGLYLLTIGTFLGGVWANESWGRYWSWDPKEVWALISMMIYIFILHMRLVPGLRGKFAFNFASMISIATLIMTYFGVNYYLSGMHSYGKGDPVPIPDWIYYFIVFVAIFSVVSYFKYKKIENK
jgi:cytochrome c-type biogenesis protein CcsB